MRRLGLLTVGAVALCITVLPGIALAKEKDRDGTGGRGYDISRDARDIRHDSRDIRHDRVDAYRDERLKDRIQADLRRDLAHPLANAADIRKDLHKLDRVQYDLNRDRRDLYRDRVDRRRDVRDLFTDTGLPGR